MSECLAWVAWRAAIDVMGDSLILREREECVSWNYLEKYSECQRHGGQDALVMESILKNMKV